MFLKPERSLKTACGIQLADACWGSIISWEQPNEYSNLVSCFHPNLTHVSVSRVCVSRYG
ncbi:hypothetical protein BGY98DRAFT_991253 [Russula aff. rugulosa BPL654]|nr:hypothetical protein BGY98DRAFT_991253 [Russula aff. rugulosa BPL654]